MEEDDDEIRFQARAPDIVLDGGRKSAVAKADAAKTDTAKTDTTKSDATRTDTTLQPWTLNGQAMKDYSSKPAFSVKRGTPVVLAFINKTAFLQQMHVHGHCFRLLHDLDDGWEPYWRDCVLVPEGRTKHVAFIADSPGKWVIESLIAERQAAGMMTWFEVT